MSARGDAVTNRRSDVLLVPTRAITPDKSGKPTVKLTANGQLQQVAVATGVSNCSDTEVISGLNEGDTIIIERQGKTNSSGFLGG
jgi:HlyD family secretion protein